MEERKLNVVMKSEARERENKGRSRNRKWFGFF